VDETRSTDGGDQRWTPLASELRRLRSDAGDPSFQTIAARVRDARLAAGESPAGARVARSTVYDCFRDGRTRMSLPLVREIALALGVPEDGVDDWVAAARAPTGPAVEAPERPEEPPAPVEPSGEGETPSDPSPPAGAGPLTSAEEPAEEPAESPGAPGRTVGLAVLAGCVALNLAGLWFVAATDVPFFLDMAGTAVAAIALGPWRGVLVAVLTSVIGLGTTAPEELGFVVVNVAGALLWGYGVRSWGLGRTLPRFLTLNLGVGAVCTALAVPVLLLVAGTEPRGPQDQLTVTFAATLGTYVGGLVVANLVASLVDKLVAGFVALVAVSALPVSLRRDCGLVVADPRSDVEDGETAPSSR
jgi:energy-coupling factor transport system substrate-specific component